MDGPDENQIKLKKDIIQAEIIDKNYDTEKFFAFCLKKKENGDDLANWSLLELNDVINDFISQINSENVVSESLDGENTINSNKEANVEDKKEKEKINLTETISKEVTKLVEKNESEIEVTCKKLELSPINNKEITVVIRNPKANDRNFFESSYITYEVVTESMQWLVRRRFSDFEWLRSILCKCFPRVIVPPIPGKKIGSRRFEEDFILKRMGFLQKFIDAVVANESFKTNEALVAFLSMIDRGQFDSKMREMTTYQPSPYVDDMKTLSGKLYIVYDEQNEKYYKNIGNYFKLQNQLYERLNFNMKNFYSNISEACLSLDEVQKDFETLHLLNSRILMKNEITKTFEELGIFFKNWKRILFNQNEIFKDNIKDFFKYLRMEGEAYTELIESREVIRKKYNEENEKVTAKKERLWQTMDITRWEIIDEFNKIDRVLLLKDKHYALSKMCTKDTKSLENIHKQLGYANRMNGEELRRLIELNCQRFVKNMENFAERFYPTFSDGISVWTTLTNYL